jgi:two-component system OmpR family sensor kinase
VALSDLVASRVQEFRSDHPEREVRDELASALAVRGREDLLDRLLVNALSNIVRHTPKDAAVRVTLRRDSARVVLTVEDSGGGLPEYGVRPQRFRRFDQSRSRETGGSGLGMSIMADIVEGLGGSLTTSKSSLGGLALTFNFALES